MIKSDFDAEVEAGLADGHANALERKVGICLAVANDDGAAAAAEEFVEAHVVEVTAVGEVDVRGGVVRLTEELIDQAEKAEARGRGQRAWFEREESAKCIWLAGWRDGIWSDPANATAARIAEPPSETHVEDGEKKCDGGVGVVAHAGAGGSAGDGARGGKRDGSGIRVYEARSVNEPVELVPVVAGGGPADVIAGEDWREDKARGFALLVGEILAGGEIDGGADDGKRAFVGADYWIALLIEYGVSLLVEYAVPDGEKLMDTQTAVVSGEAGEEIGNAMEIDSAPITAGQPVAIEGVHGEVVDIDTSPEEEGYRQAEEEEKQEAMLTLERSAVRDNHAPRDEGGENEEQSEDKDRRRNFGEQF